MKKEDRIYEVTPRIVKANTRTTISIKSNYSNITFDKKDIYNIYHWSMDYMDEGQYEKPVQAKVLEDKLNFDLCFEGEQEHILKAVKINDSGDDTTLGFFNLYSLEEDLYELKPLKADFHMHSTDSDGQAAPEVVAGCFRMFGFDVIALTDHFNYQGSVNAQKVYDGVDTGLTILRGEEVHTPDNPVHIVSVGSDYGITEIYKKDISKFKMEVEKIRNELKDIIPQDVNSFHYASCIWAFKEIKKANGLSIFAHPYWIYNHEYHISTKITQLLMETKQFDIFELLGGVCHESIMLQLALYKDHCDKGNMIPFVASSDAHVYKYSLLDKENNDYFSKHYTILFAKQNNYESIKESILKGMTVAVLNDDTLPCVYGSLRLVKYTNYLLREIYPVYYEMCQQEGRCMLDYVKGNEDALQMMRLLRKNTKSFINKTFGYSGEHV